MQGEIITRVGLCQLYKPDLAPHSHTKFLGYFTTSCPAAKKTNVGQIKRVTLFTLDYEGEAENKLCNITYLAGTFNMNKCLYYTDLLWKDPFHLSINCNSQVAVMPQTSFSLAMSFSSYWTILRLSQARWDMQSLWHVLCLPQGLLPLPREPP